MARPRQLDLFAAAAAPSFDAAFARAERIELADGAWVDHVPGWVSGHDVLFEELERSLKPERTRYQEIQRGGANG